MIAYEYFTRKWPSLATSARFMSALRNTFERQGPQRAKAVAKLQGMIAENKWEAAHDELYRLLDGLWVGGYLLTADEQKRYFAIFSEVKGAIDAEMAKRRSQQAQRALSLTRAEQAPDFDSLVTAMETAVSNVARTGQSEWNSAVLDGPGLISAFGDAWQGLHVATLRCQALDWALATRRNTYATEDADTNQPPGDLSKITSAFAIPYPACSPQ